MSCYNMLQVSCICTQILTLKQIDFDPSSTQRKFAFASKHQLPFFYVSAADGTNVVRIFEEAIGLAIKTKENPEDDVGSFCFGRVLGFLEVNDEKCGR